MGNSGITAECEAAEVCDRAGSPDCGACPAEERAAVLAAKKQGSRVRGRPFPRGVSGNPKGRPRGSRNKVTVMLTEMLDGEGEAIMGKLIDLAKAGRPLALRLAMERLVPIRAARDRTLELEPDDLPPMQRASDLVAALGAVIRRAAAGDITLSEAREFAGLIEMERRAIETADLAVKVEALEARGVPVAEGRRIGFAPGEATAAELRARIRRLSEPAREDLPVIDRPAEGGE